MKRIARTLFSGFWQHKYFRWMSKGIVIGACVGSSAGLLTWSHAVIKLGVIRGTTRGVPLALLQVGLGITTGYLVSSHLCQQDKKKPQRLEPQLLRGASRPIHWAALDFKLNFNWDLILKRHLGNLPQLEIGGVRLPDEYERLGVGFFGAPGTGKSVAIEQIIQLLQRRPDFRVIVLDRGRLFYRKFFREGLDLVFDPKDSQHSIAWNHTYEPVDPETLAATLVPEPTGNVSDPFWPEAARNLVADIFERTYNNQEVWQVVTRTAFEDPEKDLPDLFLGTVSYQYFFGERPPGNSVLATLINKLRFYQDLPDLLDREPFSFYHWGREDDPRWIYVPLDEGDVEKYKHLHSCIFELVMRGILSHSEPEKKKLKTAIILDEFPDLPKMESIPRISAQSRKYGGCMFLGAQSEAQIRESYGENITRTILQNLATKLILACPDPQTARIMAESIGSQELVEYTASTRFDSSRVGETTISEHIRETSAVLATEIQDLPSLEGFLKLRGKIPARVKLKPRLYRPANLSRVLPRTQTQQQPTQRNRLAEIIEAFTESRSKC